MVLLVNRILWSSQKSFGRSVYMSALTCSWYMVGKTVVENVCLAVFHFKMCVCWGGKLFSMHLVFCLLLISIPPSTRFWVSWCLELAIWSSSGSWTEDILLNHFCCFWIAQSYPTLCNAMDCSTLGFPVHHHSQSLLKFMSIKSVMSSYHLFLCVPFSSCLQSFPASRSFPMSQFFTSGGQNIGASASVPPVNILKPCCGHFCK